MRLWIGFLVAVALVAVPLRVSADEGAPPQSVETQPGEEAKGASPSWLQRMHPGALEGSAETPAPRPAIEYVPAQPPAEPKPKRPRGARIAMGVVIPVLAVGAIAGIAVAASVSQDIGSFSW